MKTSYKRQKRKRPKGKASTGNEALSTQNSQVRATLHKYAVFSLRLMQLFKHIILLILTASWCKKQDAASGPSTSHLTLGLSCLCRAAVCAFIFGQGLRKESMGILRGRKHPEGEKAEKGYIQSHCSKCRGYTPVRRERRSRQEEGGEERASSAAFTCHVRLAGPQGLKNQLQLPDSCGRLFSTGHVRLQDQFQKADPYQTDRVSLTGPL